MKRGINRVILVGHLGRDPEIKYTADGKPIATITVATSESWKDKQSGEQKERTEWTRVVAFQRLAEIMGEYLKKGSQVYIDGKLQTRKWQDSNGQDRWTTEVVANDMLMLSGRPQEQKPSDQGFRKPAQQPVTHSDFADDDIPF